MSLIHQLDEIHNLSGELESLSFAIVTAFENGDTTGDEYVPGLFHVAREQGRLTKLIRDVLEEVTKEKAPI